MQVGGPARSPTPIRGNGRVAAPYDLQYQQQLKAVPEPTKKSVQRIWSQLETTSNEGFKAIRNIRTMSSHHVKVEAMNKDNT